MGLELQGMRREIERGETKDTEDSVVDLTWLGVLRSYKSRSLLSALCMRSAIFIAQGTGDTKIFVKNAMYALLGIVICTRRRSDCCSNVVRRPLMSYPSVLITYTPGAHPKVGESGGTPGPSFGSTTS